MVGIESAGSHQEGTHRRTRFRPSGGRLVRDIIRRFSTILLKPAFVRRARKLYSCMDPGGEEGKGRVSKQSEG